MPPFPILRYLTPPLEGGAPAGFALIDQAVIGPLPFTLSLDAELSLSLSLPTGQALAWREAPTDALVGSSEGDLLPAADLPGPTGAIARPPLRLLLRRNGAIIGTLALVAGLRRSLPDAGAAAAGALVELIIIGWELRAGALRGPGDSGSRLRLAWRRVDGALNQFSTPPPPPTLVARLPLQERVESQPALNDDRGDMVISAKEENRRFRYKKVVRR
jgi:hypothetical protein